MERCNELQHSLDELQVAMKQLNREKRQIREKMEIIMDEMFQCKKTICAAPPLSDAYFAYIQRVSASIAELQFDPLKAHTAEEFTAYNNTFDDITRMVANEKKEQIFEISLASDMKSVFDFAFKHANGETVKVDGLVFGGTEMFNLYIIDKISTRINNALGDRIVLNLLSPEAFRDLIVKIKTYHANVEFEV